MVAAFSNSDHSRCKQTPVENNRDRER